MSIDNASWATLDFTAETFFKNVFDSTPNGTEEKKLSDLISSKNLLIITISVMNYKYYTHIIYTHYSINTERSTSKSLKLRLR